MKLEALTFKGGTHPNGFKDLSNGKPWIVAEAPDQITIAMHQHIGAPCEAIVQKGDHVNVGQKIGEAKAFVSAPVHSSVSGTVSKIESVVTPDGRTCQAVTIDNDKEYTLGYEVLNRTLDEVSAEEIRAIVREAGITGQGGASFPTHVKLTVPEDNPIDTVILNGAECEPYLTCDQLVMENEGEKVLFGLKAIMKAVGAETGIVAIESNKPCAIKNLRALNKDENIHIASLVPKYPQGDEKRIINACLNREVPSGGLPMHVGVVVDNVGTAKAIAEAVREGKPLYERLVTVTGHAAMDPKNVLVKNGTPLDAIIEAAGGLKEEPGKIIMGGPMMGIAQYSLDHPAVKGLSGLLCMTKKEAEPPVVQKCMKCGKCVEACPVHLLPLYIQQRALRGLVDEAQELHALDCIECGSCSYVCPAKRPLVEAIRLAKRGIRAKEQKTR